MTEIRSHRKKRSNKLEAWGVLIAAAVGAFSVGFFPTAAKATPTPTPEPYCSTWKMRGATGQYPEVTFGDKPADSSFTENRARLTKPSEGVMPGVEFATFNANIDLAAPATLSVDYELVGGAKHDAGAIRMFYYTAQNADTLNDGPTASAIVTSTSGTLTIPDVEVVGTLGLVYDASNDGKGTVIFENMKLGDMPIKFKTSACPTEEPTTVPPTTTPPTPQDCEAYLYTETKENLCKEFPGNQEDITCEDVKYRVTLVNENNDPWGLDGNTGTPGIGCESNPLKPTTELTPAATPSPVGLLPVTGDGGGNKMPYVVGAAAVVLVAGALLVFASRTRKVVTETPSDDL